MKDATPLHEPTAEFRSHLEWQIESALRRESRLAAPVSGGTRRLRVAFIVVVALAAGVAAGAASGRVQDARDRNRLIESAHAEESLMQTRLELARAEYQEARRRFEAGTIGRETLLTSERQFRAMETALQRLHLDMEEIQATSTMPRNGLDAPLVGQRDFVRDRLLLDMKTADSAMREAEVALQEARRRVEIGAAPRAAALQVEAELAQARARLQELQGTRELRDQYLRHEIKSEQLATAARRLHLMAQRDRASRELEIARSRLQALRAQFEIGNASSLELKRGEVELLEHEVELQRVERELEGLVTRKR